MATLTVKPDSKLEAGGRRPVAAETMGVIINFGDILSIDEPVVNSVIENSVMSRLDRVPHRQFKLTPRIMVVLFERDSSETVAGTLRRAESELSAAHCGRLAWKMHELRNDMAQFRADCRELVEVEKRHAWHNAYRAATDQLGSLLHIVDSLHTVDLAFHMRQQPAVRLIEGDEPDLIFDEWTIGLDELERAVGLPIRDELWKFEHITEFLDFKTLELVARDWKGDRPVAINFHVKNVLSLRFIEMAHRVIPEWRRNLVFELSVSELIRNESAYVAAIKQLRESGFGVTADSAVWPIAGSVSGIFPAVQFVKVPWTDAIERCGADQKARIRAVIAQAPDAKFVLCRCGHKDNIAAGKALGFDIFQGWAVPMPRSVAAPAHRRGERSEASKAAKRSKKQA